MTGIVNMVGCGPGGASWVLPQARATVERCDIVFGPSDLQSLFPEAAVPRVDLPARPDAAAPLVRAALERGLSCAVLVRGDCGVRSLARGLERLLPPGSCRRVPGISSVQAACAAFGVDWDEARIVSAHGRDPGELDADTLRAPALVLLGGGDGFGAVVDRLAAAHASTRRHIASDLTLPSECIRTYNLGEPLPADHPSRTVAILCKEPS